MLDKDGGPVFQTQAVGSLKAEKSNACLGKVQEVRMSKIEALCSTAREDKAAEQLFVIRCRGL